MPAYVPLNTTWHSVKLLTSVADVPATVNPLFAHFADTLAGRADDALLESLPKAWLLDIVDQASGILSRNRLTNQINDLPDYQWTYELALLTEGVTLSTSDDQILSYELGAEGYARQIATFQEAPAPGQDVSYRTQPVLDAVFGPLLIPTGQQAAVSAIALVVSSATDDIPTFVSGLWMLPSSLVIQSGESVSVLADSLQIGAQ